MCCSVSTTLHIATTTTILSVSLQTWDSACLLILVRFPGVMRINRNEICTLIVVCWASSVTVSFIQTYFIFKEIHKNVILTTIAHYTIYQILKQIVFYRQLCCSYYLIRLRFSISIRMNERIRIGYKFSLLLVYYCKVVETIQRICLLIYSALV